MEIEKAEKLAIAESKKFEEMVKAIGPETIVAMANAGPEF